MLDGHDFARVRVLCFEHVVEQAPYVCDFAGGESRCELCEGVGCFVDEGVDGEFGVLVFDRADFEVVVLDFGVYGLDRGGYVWLGYVAGGPRSVGIWNCCKSWKKLQRKKSSCVDSLCAVITCANTGFISSTVRTLLVRNACRKARCMYV